MTAESIFGCVSAGWSLTVFHISPAVTHDSFGFFFVLLSWPAGSCQDARRLAPSPSRTWAKRVPLIVIFLKKSPQDPTIKTNRPRVLFPQQWRHESPPLPLASKQTTWNKTSVSAHRRAFSRRLCAIEGDISRAFIFYFTSLILRRLSRDWQFRKTWWPADSCWRDEGRGGSEVTWQTVHVIIVILVALWWDGLRSRWSPTRRPSSLTRADPDRHRRLTGPEDGNLADGWVRAGGGGRCEDPGCSSAPTLLPNKNKTGTKTITARLVPVRAAPGDLAPQTWTVSPRVGSRYAKREWTTGG